MNFVEIASRTCVTDAPIETSTRYSNLRRLCNFKKKVLACEKRFTTDGAKFRENPKRLLTNYTTHLIFKRNLHLKRDVR